MMRRRPAAAPPRRGPLPRHGGNDGALQLLGKRFEITESFRRVVNADVSITSVMSGLGGGVALLSAADASAASGQPGDRAHLPA